MPGPRSAMNFPTGVSSRSARSNSTRLSPTRTAAASTPCDGTVSRCSSSAPNKERYVSTASSRSSTATPRWWMPFACTARVMLPRLDFFRRVAPQRDDSADGLAGSRLRLDVGEQSAHLVADERFLLEQSVREAVEPGAMLRDQPHSLGVRAVGETCLLEVAHLLRLLGERVVIGTHRARDDALRHAVFEDHRAREVGDLLEVVGGAVRDAAEHDLLGRPARERDLHPVDELLARVQVPLLVGKVERVAQS